MPRPQLPANVRRPPTVRKCRVERSKRVDDRIKAAGRLQGSIVKFKARAAAGFSLRFADELRDGETVPDQSLALELTGRSVMRAIEELTEADDVYCGQGTDRKKLNGACLDVARWEIYPELVDVRRAIDTTFGREEGQRLHGMQGKTRRKPGRLYPQLQHLVKTLEDPRLELPAPRRPEAVIDVEGWRSRLKPGYLKLTSMLERLAKEESREQLLREARDYELEAFDVVYSEALAFVRSVFCLAGLGDREIRDLLPYVQRRRLKGKARRERDARSQGRRQAKAPPDAGDSDRPAEGG